MQLWNVRASFPDIVHVFPFQSFANGMLLLPTCAGLLRHCLIASLPHPLASTPGESVTLPAATAHY